jgi:acyl-CoA thioester hydrolase
MTFDLADRGIYGFATSEHLRFADVDANGHINNGAFLQLLENARVSYMRRVVRSGLPRFRVVSADSKSISNARCSIRAPPPPVPG